MNELNYLQERLNEAQLAKARYSSKENLPWWEEEALKHINKEIDTIIDIIATVKAFNKITLKTA